MSIGIVPSGTESRVPMRVGLALASLSFLSWPEQVKLVQLAETNGYDSVWVGEAYSWDAVSQLAALAATTERIRLVAGIINVFSRSPALIGQTAATLDRISQGRFTLGLGSSSQKLVEGWHGLEYAHPTQRMRETIDIVRLVIARERVRYSGRSFCLTGGLKFVERPERQRTDIYLATLTPAGLKLTGEVADGWIATFLSPAHYSRTFEPHLRSGAASAGRPIPRIAAHRTVAIADDLSAARELVRPHIALYVGGMGTRERNFYRDLFVAYGFRDEAFRIQELFLERRRDEATSAVTDEMIDAVASVGTVDDCRRQLAQLSSIGWNEIVLDVKVAGSTFDAMASAVTDLRPS